METKVKIKNKGKGKLFENPIMDALSRTHPAIIMGMYIPFSIFLVWFYISRFDAGVLQTLGIFAGGVFFWTFAEYMLHRYVFHWINESEFSKKFHRIAHGMHHEYPRDKERLFMPPLPSIILAGSFFGLYYLILGKHGIPFTAGFIIGYLIYGGMHYAMHTRKPPKYLKYLWRMHSLHHYKYPNRYYGVSSPIWDYVFGTLVDKEEKQAKFHDGVNPGL